MKVIRFYGVKTKEKQSLMLYIGKILSMDYYVTVLTSGSFVQRTMSRNYYNDQYLITDVMEGEVVEPDYLLWDCQSAYEVASDSEESMSIFTSGVARTEVESNEVIVSRMGEVDLVLLQGLLYDSKVTATYLIKRYKVNRKKQSILVQYFNDRDEAIHLDNTYDEQLVIKGFSKAYRQMLTELVVGISGESDKYVKGWMKKAMRRGAPCR